MLIQFKTESQYKEERNRKVVITLSLNILTFRTDVNSSMLPSEQESNNAVQLAEEIRSISVTWVSLSTSPVLKELLQLPSSKDKAEKNWCNFSTWVSLPLSESKQKSPNLPTLQAFLPKFFFFRALPNRTVASTDFMTFEHFGDPSLFFETKLSQPSLQESELQIFFESPFSKR